MRIVGGSHRGRPLLAPAEDTTRPTTDRVREALFNMLLHSPALTSDEGRSRLIDGVVLDAFAGSGALSFEALSRGALHAYLFEIDPQARRIIQRNAETLKLAERITLCAADARKPGRASAPADIVFLDPPYHSGLGSPALLQLDREGWLKPDALAIVETDARTDTGDAFVAPPGFDLLDTRQQGPARLTFLRKKI